MLSDFSTDRVVTNLKLDGNHVEQALRGALKKGDELRQGQNVKVFGRFAHTFTTHIQGVAFGHLAEPNPLDASCAILSTTANDGEIVTCKRSGDNYDVQDRIGVKRGRENLTHPGGIQAIGDYVVVPAFKKKSSEGDKGEIHFYRYTPDLVLAHAFEPVKKAYSSGITNVTDENGEFYVLALGVSSSGTDFHFYLSPHNIPISDNRCQFEFQGMHSFQQKYTDNISLIADQAGHVYFLGLREEDDGSEFADLFRIKVARDNGSEIPETDDPLTEVKTLVDDAEVDTPADISFRWGGSALVTSDTTMKLVVCERDTVHEVEHEDSITRRRLDDFAALQLFDSAVA